MYPVILDRVVALVELYALPAVSDFEPFQNYPLSVELDPRRSGCRAAIRRIPAVARIDYRRVAWVVDERYRLRGGSALYKVDPFGVNAVLDLYGVSGLCIVEGGLYIPVGSASVLGYNNYPDVSRCYRSTGYSRVVQSRAGRSRRCGRSCCRSRSRRGCGTRGLRRCRSLRRRWRRNRGRYRRRYRGRCRIPARRFPGTR